ncbi:hypothetical protein J6590_015813 [Homalodisca vitripennis]|nr:hypothetical protein J6590_015813 [Homalodisca vitripennis]
MARAFLIRFDSTSSAHLLHLHVYSNYADSSSSPSIPSPDHPPPQPTPRSLLEDIPARLSGQFCIAVFTYFHLEYTIVARKNGAKSIWGIQNYKRFVFKKRFNQYGGDCEYQLVESETPFEWKGIMEGCGFNNLEPLGHTTAPRARLAGLGRYLSRDCAGCRQINLPTKVTGSASCATIRRGKVLPFLLNCGNLSSRCLLSIPDDF